MLPQLALAAALTMSLSACGPEDIDIEQAIQRSLPDMPKFCHPLSRAEILDTLSSLKGRPSDVVVAALGNKWLSANSEKAACVTWYQRQQKRYKGG